MPDLTTAELLGVVAREVAHAVLTASGTPRKPPTPTTPRPGQKPLNTPKPIRRALTASDLAVCVHEAGHAVAGVTLGAELRNAVVGELRGGLKGLTTYFGDTLPAHRKLEISYAGPWAQAKFQAGGRRPTQRQLFAVFDGHGCHDQRALVAGGGLHEGSSVQPLIDRCWPAVLTVARQLHLTGEVHHEDVCAALGVTDGGGMGSVQLASIRSGGRVPPFMTTTTVPA